MKVIITDEQLKRWQEAPEDEGIGAGRVTDPSLNYRHWARRGTAVTAVKRDSRTGRFTIVKNKSNK